MGETVFWQINAFTTLLDGGNPAGVMLLEEWPDDGALLQRAREIALPATAFLVPDQSGDADYEVAWFSREAEISLCGHASLAAGFALANRDGGEAIVLRTRRSGLITIRRIAEGFEVSLPAIETRPSQRKDADALLGIHSPKCWRSELGYNLFILETEEEVRGLAADFGRLARLPNDQFIATAPGDHTDIVSRVFKGGNGAGEDSVTGSAHAVLAPYWSERLGRDAFTAHQASERGGDLAIRVEGNSVWIGGHCVIVAAP